MPGPDFPIIDRLLALQAALQATPEAAASSFVERAALLLRIGARSEAAADAEHAHRLDPADPRAMALFCRLADELPPAPHHGDIAVALLVSPFASPAERQAALGAMDATRLPLVLRHDLPLAVRLTLVHGRGDALALDGTGPQDQVQPLGQDKARGVFAVDCLIARAEGAPRQLTLRLNQQEQCVDIPAIRAAAPSTVNPELPAASLTILMPVKDGGPVLADCLRSTLGELSRTEGGRLVIVDDGSTQAETLDMLARAATRPDVTLIRGGGGLGFTAAVNLGLRHIGKGPVLLLNSDVWVPAGTFARMLHHLRDADVGTVTPLSNNAGSFCLLGPGKPARMPAPDVCEHLAQAADRHNFSCAIDVPSGNGFAMLISEECLRAVGPLSGIYESGYYEEVDFCLRATLRGWRHVAAADCFVGHVGSVTYGATKHRLTSANFRRLQQRFPDYADLYQGFVALDPLATARRRILAELGPDRGLTPIDEHCPRPDMGGRIMLPSGIGNPVVLPCQGDIHAVAMTHRFRRLRIVPRLQLHAAGVALYPDHNLLARFDEATETMLILDGPEGRPLVEIALRHATETDLAKLEVAVLGFVDAVAQKDESHALSV
ncbi:MAG: glycosyltransferase [Gemmobacter sp.]